MTPDLFLELAIRPALRLLPARMSSHAAEAMVLAIALQESRLEHRRQISGPARGYAQFEYHGVGGVLRHDASRVFAAHLCTQLDVEPVTGSVHAALEYHDVLTAGFARLLLWTLPAPLPSLDDVDEGWAQYMAAWRPGKPRPYTWADCFVTAWHTVTRTGMT